MLLVTHDSKLLHKSHIVSVLLFLIKEADQDGSGEPGGGEGEAKSGHFGAVLASGGSPGPPGFYERLCSFPKAAKNSEILRSGTGN